MANPQKENGYIPVSNEIADALMRVNLSAYESRVLWFLFRKTYGWNKKVDWITLSQFSACIGLDRRLIHRALKGLSSKKMIVINRDDKFKIRYGFQKDYGDWILEPKNIKLSSKEMTSVINRDDGLSSKEMTKLSSKEMNNKRHYTKDTIQKTSGVVLPVWLDEKLWNDFKEHRKAMKAKLTPKAEELAIKALTKLKDLGNDVRSVVEQSIMNGWKGLFEIKQGGNGNARTTTNFKDKHGSGLSPEQEREADAINAEYYRRKALEAANKTAGNT